MGRTAQPLHAGELGVKNPLSAAGCPRRQRFRAGGAGKTDLRRSLRAERVAFTRRRQSCLQQHAVPLPSRDWRFSRQASRRSACVKSAERYFTAKALRMPRKESEKKTLRVLL